MKRSYFRPLAAGLTSLLLSAGLSHAIVVTSASPGYQPLFADPGPDGLAGQYWDRGVTEIPVDGTALAMGGWAETNVYSTTPTGTFIFSDTVDYLGNDLTEVSGNAGTWLSNDAATYIGTTGNLDDGIIRLTGFFCIANPNTTVPMSLNTDDGSRLFIGGQESITNDGSHGDVTVTDTVTFVDAGYYPVEVRFFNGDWTSDTAPGGLPNHSGNPDPGVHGGANFRFDNGGLPMIQSVVPEPTLFSLILGMGGVAAILRRRRA